MCKKILALAAVSIVSQASFAKLNCDVNVLDSEKGEATQTVSTDDKYNLQVIVLPDNTITTDESSLQTYLEANKEPGKDYSESEEGMKNQMDVLHGTIGVTVDLFSEIGNDNNPSNGNIESMMAFYLDRDISPESGALINANVWTKEPSNSLALNAIIYEKAGSGSFRSVTVNCNVAK